MTDSNPNTETNGTQLEEVINNKNNENDKSFGDLTNIFFIILQNKKDYRSQFSNKEIWTKNMKSYIHSYIKNNADALDKYDYIQVPKYLIDAPFETPDESDSNKDYDESNYEIIIDNEIDETSKQFKDIVNHYVVSIYKLGLFDEDDEDEDEDEDDDETSSESSSDNVRLGYVASFCTGLLLSTYLIGGALLMTSIYLNLKEPLVML